MKRFPAALLVTALAAGATFLETYPEIRTPTSGWLAANALPKNPEIVTAIEIEPPGPNIATLDAALALRAVSPHAPRAVAFLDPIASGEDDALLSSKLSAANFPVVLTSNERLVPLDAVGVSTKLPTPVSSGDIFQTNAPAGCTTPVAPMRVSIVAARDGVAVASNVLNFCMTLGGVSASAVDGRIPGWLQAGATYVPVDTAGCATIGPLASRYVKRISLNQLMLRTERSEQGSISPELDALFRGRLVVIQFAGNTGAAGLAAIRNNLAETAPPPWLAIFAILLAATLAWWPGTRRGHALAATMVTAGWLLLALAIYQEFRLPMPLLGMLLLPLLALIPSPAPRKSNESEQRELAA